jgi:hypothetical protein
MLLDVDDLYIVRYYEERGFFDMLAASRMPELPDFNAIESPRFLYLWKP